MSRAPGEYEAECQEWRWHCNGTGPSTWPVGRIHTTSPWYKTEEEAEAQLAEWRRQRIRRETV